MKRVKITAILALVVLLVTAFATISEARVSVRGYYKKNGTYVQPHYRSDPDSSFSNNWSTYGNVNPYTGRSGYKTYKYTPYRYKYYR